MKLARFGIQALDGSADREPLDCGIPVLNNYLCAQAPQDVRRRVAACFVALVERRIAGYYTLASASAQLGDLPDATARKLPRYPSVPMVRMGRLAVDRTFQGVGLGSALLADAFQRTLDSEIAAYAMIVDAKDSPAASFYLHHGFIALNDQPLTLFLPLATAQKCVTRG